MVDLPGLLLGSREDKNTLKISKPIFGAERDVWDGIRHPKRSFDVLLV